MKQKNSAIATEIEGTENTRCNDSVIRRTTWEGKIELIYPSDFGYTGGSTCTSITNDACGTTNWLSGDYYWTISPAVSSDWSYHVWFVGDESADHFNAIHDVYGGRLALYLKSNVQIIDGDGSSVNPYKLSM